MKFSIIINKLANFYFFVQNLSEWHFSNQKDYNVLWRKELEQFSMDEEDALKQFKEIRLQYKQSRTYFEQAFFVAENPWKSLEKNLPQNEYAAVQKIFNLLENKFNLIYEKNLVLLNQWKEILQEKINDPALTESIADAISTLLNTTPSKSEVKIYLLFSAPNHTGGGANIDDESISLEVSQYSLDGANHAMGIIWHETIHLCFQNQYFFPLVLKQFPDDRQKADLINEITIGSLFPRGILGVRLLKNKPASRLMTKINSEQTIRVSNLTKEYISDQKSLDEKYIRAVAEILKI